MRIPKVPKGRHAAQHIVLCLLACLLLMPFVARAATRAQDGHPDFSGVWALVQHDRLGARFFIPYEPERTDWGKKVTGDFAAKYDVVGLEANGHCVEPGMPTVMWGIGGSVMEIVQQDERITLLSELANQTRRIFLDGRDGPANYPNTRVGYSLGHWDGDSLVIETRKITEWYAPRWPHSDQMRISERWYLTDASTIKITGLRPENPPKVTGTVLIDEMTISDPKMYKGPPYVVTYVYRPVPDGAIFYDGCSEGIWREALEKDRQARAARAVAAH
jgi:hypothetical protein